MKIGIYSESSRGTTSIGGSEFIVVVLAEWLARQHDVEIIHHSRSLTAEHFANRFGVDAQGLSLRYRDHEQPPSSANPWHRHREEQQWHSELSAGYDLFIDVAHEVPPICRARAGFLYVLFPFSAPPAGQGGVGRAGMQSKFWIAARDAYLRWIWRKRLESYQLKAAISAFSAEWVSRRWRVAAEVIYPPCDAVPPRPKENLILSVGRFSAKGVMKKQPEMIRAMNGLEAHARGWEYVSAGGLSPAADEQAFFEELTRQAAGSRVRLVPNSHRDELRELFGRAKIFWHATGLSDDESQRPQMAEHFGIVTVEAMSAGCVPVVIRKGAQAEIVEHGVSGFLWNTLDELQAYTLRLIHDEALLRRMSLNARGRAEAFSRGRFIERFEAVAGPLLKS